MAKKYLLAIHDMNGKRLCTVYDSEVEQDGSAYDIEITKELNGWKEVKFTISNRTSTGEENYRLNYLKNENLLYLYEDGACDVYVIKVPVDSHDSNRAQKKITANHISEELKAKNLYKYFTDENGISNCETLIRRALGGSGWTLEVCDTFYEADGETEKIRSYSCDTKTGAYTMISDICGLFKARPIFHGLNKTLEIRSIYDSTGWIEICYGRNLDKITRQTDSAGMATRLYVEGEYGNQGYVGIDSVNPTGLPFILNFDYYKELGTFTAAHQQALDDYVSGYKALTENISNGTTELLERNADLIRLIGTCGYIYCPIESGSIKTAQMICGGTYSTSDKGYENGDDVVLVTAAGSYEHYTYSGSLSLSGKTAIIKFVPTITGLMAAHEDLITASNDTIPDLLANLNKFLRKNEFAEVSDVAALRTAYDVNDLSLVNAEDFDISGLSEPWSLNTVREYTASIGSAENTATDTKTELNVEMLEAIQLLEGIDSLSKEILEWQDAQAKLDDDFASAMGSMLRDGYWSDDNYAVGQEESLYQDALEISKQISRPIVSYNFGLQDISVIEGYEDEAWENGQRTRIYDEDLKINDVVYVTETHIYPDKPKSNSLEMKNDLLDIGNKSFSTVLERIAGLAQEVKNNREIYKRAVAISRDGTISSALLEGAIDTLTTRLSSTSSNWTTDEKGNMVFYSLDGKSAMMLCGNGFMLASSKKADGSWNWRTFGTGEGFTADMLIAGFIAAERIAAGTIVTKHLSSEVGEELNLSSNQSVRIVAEGAADDVVEPIEQRLSAAELKITPSAIISTVTESQKYTDDLGALEDKIDDTNDDVSNLESRVSTAEQKITPNAIISTVTESTKYTNDFGALGSRINDAENDIASLDDELDGLASRVDSAEQKITPTAIVSTVRSSSEYANDLSIIEQKADKYQILITDGSTSTSVVMTQAAMEAISNQITLLASKINAVADEIDLSANGTVRTVVGNEIDEELENHGPEIIQIVTESNDYQDLQTRVQQNSTNYTIMINRIETAEEELDDVEDKLDTMATWFTFSEDGFKTGKSGSTYSTLTDDTGFHILQVGEKIGSFAKRQLAVEEIRVGTVNSADSRCIVREAADGGLIISVEGLT